MMNKCGFSIRSQINSYKKQMVILRGYVQSTEKPDEIGVPTAHFFKKSLASCQALKFCRQYQSHTHTLICTVVLGVVP